MDILSNLPGEDPKTNLLYTTIGVVLSIIGYAAKEKLTGSNINDSKRTRNEKMDSVSRGADSIVTTAEKLLSLLERNLEQEIQHRKTCEESLIELRKEIDILKKTKSDKRTINKNE